MCGIAGVFSLSNELIPDLDERLSVMGDLLRHRGPDDHGYWAHPSGLIGFAHRRLSIIDLSSGAHQPMTDRSANWVVFNGEIYNFIELREEIGVEQFTTRSDTEVILLAYSKWGEDCVTHFRGMFSFALWDDSRRTLFCARDRFGIKPFYYAIVRNTFYFASEVKALAPFLDEIDTDIEALQDYLVFQFCLGGKTLFKGVRELEPAHTVRVTPNAIQHHRFWQVYYEPDLEHRPSYFERRLRELVSDSVRLHMRSDVPVGGYVSGGTDSAIIATEAARCADHPFLGFTGRFSLGPEYDESAYAREVAGQAGFSLHTFDITAQDFIDNIRTTIYHLDYPIAGPGSFSQFMVSRRTAHFRKVVLGGQGGDEIFGGYARYLIAYFEQCIKSAIDGTMNNGNFVVTYQSIIPNLTSLRAYKPLLKEFWRDGLFDDMGQRYFRLINRASLLNDEVRWELLRGYSPYEAYRSIFYGDNVGKQSYFDLMTHFDFKTLLPALLHVEDRVSMAHGIESRVPFIDHPLVEFAATIPADVKFANGAMKHVLKNAFRSTLPEAVYGRKDKMGFPTPFTEWAKGEAKDFVWDTLTTRRARTRIFIDNHRVLDRLSTEAPFSRNLWGLLSLELWQQEFHDKQPKFKNQFQNAEILA